jgi:hypothetical protein
LPFQFLAQCFWPGGDEVLGFTLIRPDALDEGNTNAILDSIVTQAQRTIDEGEQSVG